MDRPIYPHSPIQSVQSLCCALGLPEPLLRSIARRAPGLYIGPKPKAKKNGGVRYVFDTEVPLKPLLKKINTVFFRQVNFPRYLTGSLSGRDFVANVDIHKGSRTAITEDIAQFFDCISAEHVRRIWREFFRFADDVSDLLTQLTTKDGHVFQGTPTSSYLANLVFWDCEPDLVARLGARNIRYSRYVDDITLSSTVELVQDDRRWAIAQVYGMVGGAGLKVQRAKHRSISARGPITIMGLNANGRTHPTLTKRERSMIRAQVFQVERRSATGEVGADISSALNQAAGKVGRLKRLHPKEALALKLRLDVVRRKHAVLPMNVVTPPPASMDASGNDSDSDPPF